MFAALPVEIEHPLARVEAVERSTAGWKQVHEVVGSSTLAEWAGVASPGGVLACDPPVRPAAAR